MRVLHTAPCNKSTSCEGDAQVRPEQNICLCAFTTLGHNADKSAALCDELILGKAELCPLFEHLSMGRVSHCEFNTACHTVH